ncbi:glycine zipper domain-containing protein [Pontibacter ruber]|uniref:Glycine zipper domain-containing protein n=1 Tax=Pontibacter ruber TaxID=1343895 RepID=A0ABW5CVR9_9BACT|nr:glycine zipper domain-containing protein [Pontibacter ruber]
MNLYVYPAKGQSSDQQQKDEAACYEWAKQQTGLDPANMPKVQGPAPTETSSTGEALKGGAAGAAAGAAIGAIVGGGAGEGALIGGLTGVVAGRRKGKKQEKAEQEQIQAGVSAQEQENWSRYIRAFSGCIEGKGYTIK